MVPSGRPRSTGARHPGPKLRDRPPPCHRRPASGPPCPAKAEAVTTPRPPHRCPDNRPLWKRPPCDAATSSAADGCSEGSVPCRRRKPARARGRRRSEPPRARLAIPRRTASAPGRLNAPPSAHGCRCRKPTCTLAAPRTGEQLPGVGSRPFESTLRERTALERRASLGKPAVATSGEMAFKKPDSSLMVSKRRMSMDKRRGGGNVTRTSRVAWSTTIPAASSQTSNPADTIPA